MTYAYDKTDRMVTVTDPMGYVYGYTYDAANRLTAYTDKMGLTESYTYDSAGNVRTYTDTDGLTTTYVYDLKSRLTGVTSPVREGETSALTAVYTYDEMDNLTGVTDFLGRTTAYTYDIEGNLTSVTDATGRTEIMTYDVAGRLTSYTSNGGNTVSYDYDKLNNLVEKSYTDATGTQAAEDVVYAYDALGQRVEMFDTTGDTAYTYDALGRITSVTTYRTPGEAESGFSHEEAQGDTVTYTYDEADNLSAITYPDGTSVLYEYDLNDNLTKVTDREGNETTYVYDAIGRITEIHRPNGISTYNTYNARNQITELTNICDDCEWVVSSYAYTYDDKGFIVAETAIESLAGYAYDDKHDGKHEDGIHTAGKHDDLYPHGNNHSGKHDKDATFAYQIVQTDRTFTYDDAGKLLSATETEDNYGTYAYTYEYDLTGNRTAIVKTDENGDVTESRTYTYNDSNQLMEVELYNGKKTTTVTYEYDADGNLIAETGKDGNDKVELTYTYTVENRLEAVYDGKELLMAAAYDGDGNRVFQLNYNLHTDEDWKGNNGNGNGSNKDNSGSGNSSNSSSDTAEDTTEDSATEEDSTEDTTTGDSSDSNSSNGSNGNGNGNNKNKTKNGNSSANNGKGGNGKNATTTTTVEETTESEENAETTSEDITSTETAADSTSTGNGNATNAETNNSQNQSGILFPIDSETSDTEEYLIGLIKTTGKEKNYELIEYINDVNREYTEVLVEQNINGADDTTYVYGVDRLSLDRFDGSTGYYLYDPRGSVTSITNEEGQIYQSYRYNANGEITFGAPEYENEYTYNGESYNPNIESQYLRARYYDVTIAAFITEDSYLGDITEPLTLNRYNYCVSSPLNYVDKSGHWLTEEEREQITNYSFSNKESIEKRASTSTALTFLSALHEMELPHANIDFVLNYDYRNTYFKQVIDSANKRNASHECEIAYDIMNMHLSHEGMESLMYWETVNTYSLGKGYLKFKVVSEENVEEMVITDINKLQTMIEEGKQVYLIGIAPHLVGDGSTTVGLGDYITKYDTSFYEERGYTTSVNGRFVSVYENNGSAIEYMPIDISVEKYMLDILGMENGIKSNIAEDLDSGEILYYTQREFDALIIMRYQKGSLGSGAQELILRKETDAEEWRKMLESLGVEDKRIFWEVDKIMFGNGAYIDNEVDVTPLWDVLVEGVKE